MASADPASPGILDRLRSRHGRRAALLVLVLFGVLLADNGLTWIHNQRELPRDAYVDEIDEWFHVKSRDIEQVASENPRYTVFGRIGIYYFLGQRIGGTTLTIPDWMEWWRWELERVSGLDIEVEPARAIPGVHARRLRRMGEQRRFQQGSRRRRRILTLVLVVDPGATRYVLVESADTAELFVLSEERLATLPTSPGSPP